MNNIFIIGSKGIPARYGGFETFADKLTLLKKSKDIKYHVSCISSDSSEIFEHNNARCFNIKVPNIGPAKAVAYDIMALKSSIKYIKENKINNAIIYILACRIGPFMWYFKKKCIKLGIKVYLNPDGHEWKRGKWNKIIKMYWKFSEKLMVKHSDLVICDSINIEKYIKELYGKYYPKTTYISYGANVKNPDSQENSTKLTTWFSKHNVKLKGYYLIVGRFVPENNLELIIKEFIESNTKKDLVIITNVEKNKFYNKLLKETSFNKDKRIKFVGVVYDDDLINDIRERSFAYIHGHEVGGTNPALLEALASINLCILLDVGFNKEVGQDAAVYFEKEKGSLKNIIEQVEGFEDNKILEYGKKAKDRIKSTYDWNLIIEKYENEFCEYINENLSEEKS